MKLILVFAILLTVAIGFGTWAGYWANRNIKPRTIPTAEVDQ